MSGKKNLIDIERRRAYVSTEVSKRSGEKVEFVVNEIAERLFLRPTTIWNDLKNSKIRRRPNE